MEGWAPESEPRLRLPSVPLPKIQPISDPEQPSRHPSSPWWKQAARQEAGFHANNLLNGGLYTGKPYCGNLRHQEFSPFPQVLQGRERSEEALGT